MAQYESVRLGFAFRENHLHLLENDDKDVDLIIKAGVIYLFHSHSKALLKEILTTRDFRVSLGTDPSCIILRDYTKEVKLMFDCEEKKKKCLEYLQSMADNFLSKTKDNEDPVTVVFRHPQPSFMTNCSSITTKKKTPPAPLPKPKNLIKKSELAQEKQIKEMIPFGTVKAISRDLAKVLFTKPFSMNSNKNSNQKQIDQKSDLSKSIDEKVDYAESDQTQINCDQTDQKQIDKLDQTPDQTQIDENADHKLIDQFDQIQIDQRTNIGKIDDFYTDDGDLDNYECVNMEQEDARNDTAEHHQSRIPSDPVIEEFNERVRDRLNSENSGSAELEKSEPSQNHSELYKFENVYDNQRFMHDWNETIREENHEELDSNFCEDETETYASNIEIRRPWLLRGRPTRHDAARALEGKDDGAFVVRGRDGAKDAHIYPYALTVLYKNQPMHMQIQRTQSSGLVLAPWNAGEKAFDTLDDLVQYYRDNRIVFAHHSVQGFVSLQKGNFSYD